MDSEFMNDVAEGLASRGVQVHRFEFPYMAKRRVDGIRRGPGRADALVGYFDTAASSLRAQIPDDGSLFIGGKSMGGRIASMIADTCSVAGVLCLGYPFHPPGKPEKLRVAHLTKLKTPTLIIQGERDTFGTADEVQGYPLASCIQVKTLIDGDHSFKPRKKSGRTESQAREEAVQTMATFMESQAE